MGNSVNYQSEINNLSIPHNQYRSNYNLIPSLPGHEYNDLNKENLHILFNNTDLLNNDNNYIDLRNNFPDIIDIKNLPLNPIVCVSYVLHYSLLNSKLPIFPPSSMFILNNIVFFNNTKNIFSFDIIFQSILNHGICSENECKTIIENINNKLSKDILIKAETYKFINIFKVDNDLNLIKFLLKNKNPILVGITVYNNLENISNQIYLPDIKKDIKKGGIAGVLVGYIDERELFIMALSFGCNFGVGGFVFIPYKYILNSNYTFERYIINFDINRVEGYINQRRNMINLEKQHAEQKNINYKNDDFNNIFS